MMLHLARVKTLYMYRKYDITSNGLPFATTYLIMVIPSGLYNRNKQIAESRLVYNRK